MRSAAPAILLRQTQKPATLRFHAPQPTALPDTFGAIDCPRRDRLAGRLSKRKSGRAADKRAARCARPAANHRPGHCARCVRGSADRRTGRQARRGSRAIPIRRSNRTFPIRRASRCRPIAGGSPAIAFGCANSCSRRTRRGCRQAHVPDGCPAHRPQPAHRPAPPDAAALDRPHRARVASARRPAHSDP
jgi:hypothetical protein